MKSTLSYFILQSFCMYFLAGSIIACNNPESSPVAKNDTAVTSLQQLIFDKLSGTWKSEDGKSFERWTKNDNGIYRSEGFSIKGNDTSWNEQAAIYKENNNWVFENTVKGQNNGKAVKFTSSFLNEISVQFSNPAHDFPTDINYTIAEANKLQAFIVGPNNKGGKDTIPFNFTRVK
ncbi:MAG TPA: hypothetical protein VJU78_11900 [Chitinophagaceae bacterium]|nr:hypothetical protein [Chitinophagaceae bacterium]